jgi:hypothetical protein
MTKDEALKMAIKAIELYADVNSPMRNKALNACKEALEQPSQECKWCKSREVNFDELVDPLCKICGKVLGSTKECAWTRSEEHTSELQSPWMKA